MLWSHILVSTANVHTPPSVGTSVQVTVVLVVVLGQLPQFDDRMVYCGWTSVQLKSILRLFQLKVTFLSNTSGRVMFNILGKIISVKFT